jgi:hypothetical protein
MGEGLRVMGRGEERGFHLAGSRKDLAEGGRRTAF